MSVSHKKKIAFCQPGVNWQNALLRLIYESRSLRVLFWYWEGDIFTMRVKLR